jgi:S1-C subfamily serine protease
MLNQQSRFANMGLLRREKRATRMIKSVKPFSFMAAIAAALVMFSWIEPASAGGTPRSVERSRKSLGVFVAPVPPGAKGTLMLDKDRGMIVVGLAPGGVAEQAGLHKGDVLLSIDGRPVNRETDLAAALSAAPGSGQVVAEVSRGGKVLEIAIAL